MNDIRTVLVIDSNGTNLGEMSYNQAQLLADKSGLDLVEVGDKNQIAVMRIMDKGKWEYNKRKKEKHTKHRSQVIKEMKFRPVIEKHDQETKLNQISEFFKKGHGVKITVFLKGREKSSPESASLKLNEILDNFNGKIHAEKICLSPSGCSVIVYPIKEST